MVNNNFTNILCITLSITALTSAVRLALRALFSSAVADSFASLSYNIYV